MDFDVAVIGTGPAGVQAAIHASRRKASTVVLGKVTASAAHGAMIGNYFGTDEVSGTDLITKGRARAEDTGAVFRDQNVVSSAVEGGSFVLTLEDGEIIHAKAVIMATGISRTKLGVPGETELFGKGVSYCAVCDCNFYKGRRVVIVGNDSEAAMSASMMTGYASETHWVFWDLTANPVLVEKAEDAGVMFHGSTPISIEGDGRVESITLADGTSIPTDGVFIELGAKSAADLAMDMGAMPELDDTIKVDQSCRTEVPGLFACGDVTGRPWQVAKAVGQGCIAGMEAADYVKGSE